MPDTSPPEIASPATSPDANSPADTRSPAEAPPDRLSTDPASPHYNEALLQRGIGIRFKGQEKVNVEEYCLSEGWIRVSVGKTLDRRGRPLTLRLNGPVEAYFRG